jgi:hypothetical protein
LGAWGRDAVRGEAVPALRPVGILPVVKDKGKMPLPQNIYYFAVFYAIELSCIY